MHLPPNPNLLVVLVRDVKLGQAGFALSILRVAKVSEGSGGEKGRTKYLNEDEADHWRRRGRTGKAEGERKEGRDGEFEVGQ